MTTAYPIQITTASGYTITLTPEQLRALGFVPVGLLEAAERRVKELEGQHRAVEDLCAELTADATEIDPAGYRRTANEIREAIGLPPAPVPEPCSACGARYWHRCECLKAPKDSP